MTVPFNSATLSVEPYPHRFDPAMSPVARIDTASALELFVPPPLPQSSYPVVHPPPPARYYEHFYVMYVCC